MVNDEEKMYLKRTLEVIDKEIALAEEELKKIIETGRKLSFEDKERGEHFHVNSQADIRTQKIRQLEKSKDIPYFGRFDISSNGKSENRESIYIGRSAINSQGIKFVTDWRAPICSIYYDGQLGEVSYEALQEKYKTYLLLKRQITIKYGELIGVVDSELVSNDDLLKPYLEMNADNKMKTIIATIQKEQNRIIRMPSNLNMIIQGVAGSGKTSVALHRISYLLYAEANKLTPESFLILGPNDYFLNYISNVLPDLDTQAINEETLLEFAKSYINEKVSLRSEEIKDEKSVNANIQTFKTSLEYEKLLEKFMTKYIEKDIVPDDFKILKEVILSKEEIRKALFLTNPLFPDYDRLIYVLGNRLKNEYEDIYDSKNKKYKSVYMTLDLEDPFRKELVAYSSELYRLLKTDGVKLLKKYVKDIRLSPTKIYELFIEFLSDEECTLTTEELHELQETTKRDIKKKIIGFEDIPAIMYIAYKLSNKKTNFKQIVIDEAQDYGLFHFDVLKKINPNAYFTIYGDLAQAIYSYRSISNWDELSREVFDNNTELLTLSKSYRTTIEITENANSILKHLNLQPALPVIRHGLDVMIEEDCDKIGTIVNMLEKGYKTIAIICKTEKEVNEVNKELKKYDLNSKIISSTDTNYNGGLFVLTAAASKGLEFDGVIINNASDSIYNESSDVDMHLLYVACTRALHELNISYKGKLISLFDSKKDSKEENSKVLVNIKT